ncbi:hypothetical protein H2203_006642 [Taxawa tesnikishii (nom. ined.)]|nr:hypothetical protein H2203_006642 [Dothideales sp. JES 119]
MSSLSGLAASRADTLNAIIDSILNTTRRTPGNSHPTDLWNPDIGEMDLQRGAVAFRQRVASGALGKDDRLRAASDALDGWFTGIAELGSLVKSLRDERWDDDFDVDEDDLDLDAPQEMLSREDPDSLEETLRSSSEAAREKFLERMNEEIDKLEEGDVDTDTGHRAIFLLRLLREVTQRYRAMPRTSSSSSSSTSSHGSQPHTPSNLLSSLHDVLALHIMRQSSLYRQPERPAVALWEGTPPLPVQPSPSCFRYVRDISRRMESAGGDLWTRSALDNLKGKLIDKISQPLNEVVTAKGGSATIATSGSEINGVGGDDSDTIGAAEDQAETAGDAGDTNGAEEQRAVWVQMLFDICYLSNILRKSEEGGQAGLEKATEDLKKRAEMEDAALERVRKSALEYYKRTYLFFGVLANH